MSARVGRDYSATMPVRRMAVKVSRRWATTGTEAEDLPVGATPECSPTTSIRKVLVTLAATVLLSLVLGARGVVHAGTGMQDGPLRTATLAIGRAALRVAEVSHLTWPWDQLAVALGRTQQPAVPPLLASGADAPAVPARAVGVRPRAAQPPARRKTAVQPAPAPRSYHVDVGSRTEGAARPMATPSGSLSVPVFRHAEASKRPCAGRDSAPRGAAPITPQGTMGQPHGVRYHVSLARSSGVDSSAWDPHAAQTPGHDRCDVVERRTAGSARLTVTPSGSRPATPDPRAAGHCHGGRASTSSCAHRGVARHAGPTPGRGTVPPTHGPSPRAARPWKPGWRPTPGHPLRLLVTGDSLPGYLGPILVDEIAALAPVRGFVDVHDGTGLTRPDFVDWSLLARQQVAADHPNAVVVWMGGNDFQNMTLPGGQFFRAGSPAWTREYQRRAEMCMRIWSQGGTRRVYWLSMPPARDSTWAYDDVQINVALQRAAAQVPGAEYLDILGPITDHRRYADFVYENGQPMLVREADGVHVNAAGSAVVAHEVLRVLEQEWQLR